MSGTDASLIRSLRGTRPDIRYGGRLPGLL